MVRPLVLVSAVALLVWSPSSEGQAPPPAREDGPTPAEVANQRLIDRFQLFRSERTRDCCDLSGDSSGKPKRLFHQPGDPDSLFTLGHPAPHGEVHLQAAVEVSDVVLRALGPDLRVDPSDTRFRPAGDYRALDATGRPYQFRLGAKLVW